MKRKKTVITGTIQRLTIKRYLDILRRRISLNKKGVSLNNNAENAAFANLHVVCIRKYLCKHSDHVDIDQDLNTSTN